jgi:hypothetical protein
MHLLDGVRQWSVTLAMLLMAAASAHAQNTDSKAAAEALFDQGRQLMAEGQYAPACAKFEASQALDPGVGTVLNLAACYEKSGRIASAWAQYRETLSAARKAGSSERERIARERVQALEPRLSYLTIVTWKGQEVSVTRDGVALDDAVLSTAIPLDPGVHTVAARAAGKRAWSTQVTVQPDGDRVSVSVPILPDEAAPPGSELSAPDGSSGPQPSAADGKHATKASPGAAQRVLAIVSAAVGVAGVATGAVFGLKAASTWSDAKDSCKPQCDAAAHKLSVDAGQSGTISTVAFIVGGVGLASGAVLWFTAPESHAEAPVALRIGPGAVQVLGAF